jgi:hypothetical protein
MQFGPFCLDESKPELKELAMVLRVARLARVPVRTRFGDPYEYVSMLGYEMSPTSPFLSAGPGGVLVCFDEDTRMNPVYADADKLTDGAAFTLCLLHEIAHVYTGRWDSVAIALGEVQREDLVAFGGSTDLDGFGSEGDATTWARTVLATLFGPLSPVVRRQVQWDSDAGADTRVHNVGWWHEQRLVGVVNTANLVALARRHGLRGGSPCGVQIREKTYPDLP